MRYVVAAGWGALFGLGLAISGMAQPSRVLGFLDFAGAWDPSLMFVMAGALLVFGSLRPWVVRRRGALFSSLTTPPSSSIDKRLIVGATLFGVGWGIAGYCPGPAVVAGASGSSSALLALLGIVLGVQAGKLLERVNTQTTSANDACASDADSARA